MENKRPYRMGARAAAVAATRARIVEAAVALWTRRWYDDVTLQHIADEAGVSVQTIVNHFDGKDGVTDAAAEWLAGQVADARQAPVGQVAEIVTVLFDDYERRGDANVLWIAQADRVPAIARALGQARDRHRAWLAEVFADRLPAPGPARAHALTLHYAATDVYLWKLWRRDLGLPRPDAERAMCDLLTAIDPRRKNDE
ncbi:hypothetical protein Sru01_15120 [Sphaerisporangium rufum]|uniref:HTH tetR-type domain-containing protein n=1 Tax=Sphaerisporangium rufum TaxID=1381558 RepID=A0A919V3R3_9ACTN|nr:TetR/AcrR family transcriptional regulator [Sphaerisporangium rufum]GII76530.1 hypothetical protein Sru01_15120 [Sphaerisporangium rufum]